MHIVCQYLCWEQLAYQHPGLALSARDQPPQQNLRLTSGDGPSCSAQSWTWTVGANTIPCEELQGKLKRGPVSKQLPLSLTTQDFRHRQTHMPKMNRNAHTETVKGSSNQKKHLCPLPIIQKWPQGESNAQEPISWRNWGKFMLNSNLKNQKQIKGVVVQRTLYPKHWHLGAKISGFLVLLSQNSGA